MLVLFKSCPEASSGTLKYITIALVLTLFMPPLDNGGIVECIKKAKSSMDSQESSLEFCSFAGSLFSAS
jgi:hypothetical protein